MAAPNVGGVNGRQQRTAVDAHSLLDALRVGSDPELIRHVEALPARPARHADWPQWLHPALLSAWRAAGIARPWSHQREAADLLRRGEHVALATGTASGKSLAYLAPALTAVLEGAETAWRRGATALYLAPTKALAADQLAAIGALGVAGVRAAAYDGDTPSEERRWVRDHANYVLTNPDMVHHGLLAGHARWAPFLRGLRFVVVDETHSYRGVTGTHLAAVLRRLLRVADHYGAHPAVALVSATIGAPREYGEALLGMPVTPVVRDGSARGATTFVLCDPPPRSVDGLVQRTSTIAQTGALLGECVRAGAQALAFGRSRRGVEVLAQVTRDRLPERWAGAVAAYRGGYLPEERRALEGALRDGSIRALAATNALELGIDISGLDVVLMAGWPGTHASLWQQAGRAGRDGQDALVVLVAADDPLDAYVVRHPESVFGRPLDAVVVDPANPHVLTPHLACAAAELPITSEDARWFGPGLPELMAPLEQARVVRRRPGGWYYVGALAPHPQVPLRGTGRQVEIVESRTGRVVGTVDEAAADRHVHPGAVHIHQGQSWVVRALDRDALVAEVVRGDPGWTTHPASVGSFVITGEDAAAVDPGEGLRFARGRVRVTDQVTTFQRRLPTGEVLGEHPLDLPERVLDTVGVWWTVPPEALERLGIAPGDVAGALHAAEHASIGVLPLYAQADRWDIGGVSTVCHPDTGLPTVMVYDGYPGGAGFAARGYAIAARWLAATWSAVSGCGCLVGCPSCVMSPKCGNGNAPLDKRGAAALLGLAQDAAWRAGLRPER